MVGGPAQRWIFTIRAVLFISCAPSGVSYFRLVKLARNG
jgi:hypothetical protein